MYPLFAFAIILLLIAVAGVRYRLSPFFTLIGGAILFGLLTGSNLDTILGLIVTGIGRIVTALGIIIFCGAIIARILKEEGMIEDIISDIKKKFHKPEIVSGFAGYILAVPLGCCITSFIILSPVLKGLGENDHQRKKFLCLAAAAGVISYVLIYPTPVLIPLFEEFAGDMSPIAFDAVTLPFSLIILAGMIIVGGKGKRSIKAKGGRFSCSDNEVASTSFHPKPWIPFLVMLAAIPAGFFLFSLSYISLINFVMLAGVVTAIILASPEKRTGSIKKGAMHGGLIIFDICGAGALGYVILQNGLAESLLIILPDSMPLIIVPFIVAAILATAQGSRMVTAFITADLFSGTTLAASLSPIALILSISAGACIFSFVTDPFFWIVQRTTGDSPANIAWYYTIPLAFAGFIIFIFAVILDYAVI